MKNLLISDIFPPQVGGSGRWFWEVYRRMPRDDYLVAAGKHPDQQTIDSLDEIDTERVALKLEEWGLLSLSGIRGYMRVAADIDKIIRRNCVSAIHCGRSLPEGLLGLYFRLRYGIPYLCFVHGEGLGTARASRELTFLSSKVLKHADIAIANSRNTEALLQNWPSPRKGVRLVHPGMDVGTFVPASTDQSFLEAMNWTGRRVILTVGRLQKRKGHDVMISALKEIRREVPNVLYSIVGTGEELARLQQLAQQHQVYDCTQFLGEIDDADLVKCYQQCDVFVLPNREINGDIEGFGMVLVEAQACGKPVIAGQSGGTADTMDSPHTGLCIPCEEPGPLVSELIQILSDEDRRQQMGRLARDWAQNSFSWESQAAKVKAAFEEVYTR